VLASWGDAASDPADTAEVAALLGVLTRRLERNGSGVDAPLDDRLHSPLGRRVLDLLRTELIRAWEGSETEAASSVMGELLAIERVREDTEAAWAQHFHDHLSGPDGSPTTCARRSRRF